MGGQACVFYGAAEFSRDCDIVIIADPDNLARLSAALDELQAELQVELDLEQAKEQHLDELYWRPLKKELASLRLARRQRD